MWKGCLALWSNGRHVFGAVNATCALAPIKSKLFQAPADLTNFRVVAGRTIGFAGKFSNACYARKKHNKKCVRRKECDAAKCEGGSFTATYTACRLGPHRLNFLARGVGSFVHEDATRRELYGNHILLFVSKEIDADATATVSSLPFSIPRPNVRKLVA
eukprot:m.339786 g.339786  ORF g.339786 m.339786 type:complete len:159 (-) comp55753_c0_seq5:1447-1923(-)